MNDRTQSLFVGLTAGLASAVLLLGSGSATGLSLLLALCAIPQTLPTDHESRCQVEQCTAAPRQLTTAHDSLIHLQRGITARRAKARTTRIVFGL